MIIEYPIGSHVIYDGEECIVEDVLNTLRGICSLRGGYRGRVSVSDLDKETPKFEPLPFDYISDNSDRIAYLRGGIR
jgi:hypothetical protein